MLEEIYQNSIRKKSELTAFYLEARTTNDDPNTYIENWFIMAPLYSNVINKWLQQFEIAINIGFEKYVNDISSTGYKNWGILEFGTYLTQHLCLQIALKDISNNYNPNLLLYKAEDTMMKLHIECKWDANCISNKLLNDSKVKDIPYIKLRGVDRINDMHTYFAN
jgi:hypothetical protein